MNGYCFFGHERLQKENQMSTVNFAAQTERLEYSWSGYTWTTFFIRIQFWYKNLKIRLNPPLWKPLNYEEIQMK